MRPPTSFCPNVPTSSVIAPRPDYWRRASVVFARLTVSRETDPAEEHAQGVARSHLAPSTRAHRRAALRHRRVRVSTHQLRQRIFVSSRTRIFCKMHCVAPTAGVLPARFADAPARQCSTAALQPTSRSVGRATFAASRRSHVVRAATVRCHECLAGGPIGDVIVRPIRDPAAAGRRRSRQTLSRRVKSDRRPVLTCPQVGASAASDAQLPTSPEEQVKQVCTLPGPIALSPRRCERPPGAPSPASMPHL